ncbi:MAG: hypothetical protein M1840_008157 [Geoglossum simile]|nr:MAG: hypothetical protein M1840_008157 [Geoglossum simile]
MRHDMRKAHQEAADTSSACGVARQKPGRVIVRRFCDRIVCCNAYKLRNTLAKLRMILLSQISSNQCPIEMHTARGKLTRRLPSTYSMARHGAARQKQTTSSEGTFATGVPQCVQAKSANLKTPERCASWRVDRGAPVSRLCKN